MRFMGSLFVHRRRLVTGIKAASIITRSRRCITTSSSLLAAAPTALIFDTETTSKANFKLEPSDPAQPDLVQLGMILVDTSNWKTKAQISMLVDLREGVSIDAGAESTHGISKEDCNRFGVHPDTAVGVFVDMYRKADVVVAHNLSFDTMVIEAALHRTSHPNVLSIGEDNGKQHVCTMQASTDVVKIPGKHGKYKWPSLSEAYSFMTNEELEGGHDALVDARACLLVFQYLVEKNVVSLDEQVDKEEDSGVDDDRCEPTFSGNSLDNTSVATSPPQVNYTFTFGKYNGTQWESVDAGYREWIISTKDIWQQRSDLWQFLYAAGHIDEKPQ